MIEEVQMKQLAVEGLPAAFNIFLSLDGLKRFITWHQYRLLNEVGQHRLNDQGEDQNGTDTEPK